MTAQGTPSISWRRDAAIVVRERLQIDQRELLRRIDRTKAIIAAGYESSVAVRVAAAVAQDDDRTSER
jgi:hypothetical protein